VIPPFLYIKQKPTSLGKVSLTSVFTASIDDKDILSLTYLQPLATPPVLRHNNLSTVTQSSLFVNTPSAKLCGVLPQKESFVNTPLPFTINTQLCQYPIGQTWWAFTTNSVLCQYLLLQSRAFVNTLSRLSCLLPQPKALVKPSHVDPKSAIKFFKYSAGALSPAEISGWQSTRPMKGQQSLFSGR
jgi:hypothetical protein